MATAAGVAGLTLGAGVMYMYNGKGHSQGEGHMSSCLARCTCIEETPSCEKHDQQLLMEISKVITKTDVIMDLGIALGMKKSSVEVIQEDYKHSIATTSFEMLWKWYKEVDGLRKDSSGLKRLRKALKRVGLSKYNTDIIDRHFEDR